MDEDKGEVNSKMFSQELHYLSDADLPLIWGVAIIVHDPSQIASDVKVMEGTESQQLPMNAVCGSSPDAYWFIAGGPPST